MNHRIMVNENGFFKLQKRFLGIWWDVKRYDLDEHEYKTKTFSTVGHVIDFMEYERHEAHQHERSKRWKEFQQ